MKPSFNTILHGIVFAFLPSVLAVAQLQSPTSPAPETDVTGLAEQAFRGGTATQRYPGRKGATAPTPKTGTPERERPRSTVRTIQPGTSGPVHTTGQGAFEPVLNNKIEYGDIPEMGELISLAATDQPIKVPQLLDTLAVATNWNIVASETLENKSVRFWINQVTAKQALDVLRFNGIYYEFIPETKFLYVMTQEEYLRQEHGAIEHSEFAIKHAEVADMEAILTSLLSSSGRIISDPRTGRILVWDTEANLKAMQEAVVRLDVQLEPRVFALKFVSAESLLESISSLLTERGLAQADPRTNTLVISDLPSRLDQIAAVLEALDKKVETKTWTLSYADPKSIVERLENIVPEEMGIVTVDEDTHQVSATAIPERLTEIDELIKAWDKKRKQVEIEAYLVAASTEITRNLGVDWSYFDQHSGGPFAIQSGPNVPDYSAIPESGQRLTIGTLPFQVPLRNPLTSAPILDINGNAIPDDEFRGNRISVVLNYLDSKGDVTILSRPRVTVMDGEEANFQNTEDRPYQEGGYSQFTGTSVLDPSFNRVIPLRVQFIKVGTILKVTPLIGEEANIQMKISAEDSTAENVTVTVGDQRSTIPQKRENKTETQVLVHDGQTLVIGGLRSATIEDQVQKVPFLGDVPFLGRLFKNTEKDHRHRELLIFITPTLVDEYTRPEAERLADLEGTVSETLRHSQKPMLERMESRLSRGRNEIGVSIGESGSIHSKGNLVTLEDLEKVFGEVQSSPKTTAVVIRKHPNAPENVSATIAELAKTAGLEVEFDEKMVPFVPASP
ncbi:MAG: hypothetical protein HY706_21275 [Candidatus Hydrogenedentes bacterium]|nr:hypothetical protein [Candidatus Hydrogenedentota bacterium]